MPKNTFKNNVQKADDIGYSLTWCIETKKMVDQGYNYFWSGEHHKGIDPQRYNQRKAARKRRVYTNPHILGSC